MRTADFLDTLGVNTHIGSGPYNDPSVLAGMLAYLGTENVRQSSPIDAAGLAAMQALGKSGARLDLIVNGGGPVNLPGAMASIDQLAPYLNAVEGVNEAVIYPITYKGITGVDAAVALQKDLYAAVQADPALPNIPVYMFTLGGVDPSAFPQIGDLSAFTDFANIHSYPPHGLRPIFVIHAAIDGGRTDAPSKPVVITETGYYTLTQNVGWGGVPEALQAKYLLGLLLDEAAAGVSRTYLYDLIDDAADPAQNNQEDHFGLFHLDGTPKLAATAIHNMSAILADSGSASRSFQASDFAITATGVPYNYTGNTLALDKSDGTHVVAVWNEEQTWNPDTQTASPVQHFATTVTLPSTFHTVYVYDPTVGADPVQTLHDVSSVSLDLTDHPFFIVVPPNGGVAPVTIAPVPPPATVDLALTVSEDSWNGDAQYTVSVDGVSVGGARTATASHAAGGRETIDLGNSYAPGSHAITVAFLNDAYGGSPNTDRNLYLDGATSNGTSVLGNDVALLWSSAVTFATGDEAGPDTLSLLVSRNGGPGDSQYTIAIDGQTIGGVRTATASQAAGQSEVVQVDGSWGTGPHKVGITFLNPQGNDTLYVDQVAYDGKAVTDGLALGASDSTVSVGIGQPAAAAGSTLTLHLAEDAWQGDAQYDVTVDGVRIATGGTVTASHGLGQSQAVSFADALSSGTHDIGVAFTNDAYGGAPQADRNLFVTGIDVAGVAVSGAQASLFWSGTAHFQVVAS